MGHGRVKRGEERIMENKAQLIECGHHAKCYFCARTIKKGEKYITGSKRGWGARTSCVFNVCERCILIAYSQIEHPKKLLRKMLAEEIIANSRGEKIGYCDI